MTKNIFNINQKVVFFEYRYRIHKGIIVGIKGVNSLTYNIKIENGKILENIEEYCIFKDCDELKKCIKTQISNIIKTNNGKINLD